MAKLGPLPDAPGCLKVRLIGQQYGGKWVNVLHLKQTGATIDTAACNTIATAIRGYWATNFASLHYTNSSLQSVEVTDISSRTGAQGTDNTNVPGTNASAGAPASVAACLTLKIANRYRGGHPRMYLAGVDASAYTPPGTFTPAKVTAYQAAGRAFRTALNAMIIGGGVYQWVAVSYYHKVGGVNAYKVPPDVYVITDVVMHTRVDTMRRRLGKELT